MPYSLYTIVTELFIQFNINGNYHYATSNNSAYGYSLGNNPGKFLMLQISQLQVTMQVTYKIYSYSYKAN